MSKITVSRDEAAEALSVDVQTIDRLIAAKKLRASKIGRRVLIRVAALEAMLDANAVH
jgi:excisionase family DNA binding protein